MSPLLAPPSSEPEPPFRPREKIVEKQRYFQSVHRPTYLKGRYDAITSVAIPLALAVSSMYLVVRAPPIPRASQRPRFSNTCADRRIVLCVRACRGAGSTTCPTASGRSEPSPMAVATFVLVSMDSGVACRRA